MSAGKPGGNGALVDGTSKPGPRGRWSDRRAGEQQGLSDKTTQLVQASLRESLGRSASCCCQLTAL